MARPNKVMEEKIYGVYIRVSTEQQFSHGDSVEMQENLAKEYIKKEGGILYRVYIEGGVSASKTKLKDRKVLMECLNDAKNGLFNNLIVYRRDRLARKTEDSLAIRSLLESANCSIHFTATGEQQMELNDPYSKLMENIRSSLDEIESAQISVRVSDTMFDKAKRGEFSGGNVTYGYQNVNGYLKPIESEISTIKEVEDLYLEGYGKYSIIKWLEGEPIRNKGKRHTRVTKLKQHKRSSPKWTIDTINAILFNKTYSGYMEYTKSNKDGKQEKICVKSPYIEPIRSEETQQKIDRIRARKNESITPARRYNTSFLLTGVLVCSHCGKEYASRTVTKENGKRYSYYRCKGRQGKTIEVCPSKSYKKEVIEQFVLEEAKTYVKKFISTDVYLKFKKGLEERDDSLTDQLDEINKQLNKKQKDFESLSRLLLDLDTEDDMYEMMRDMYQKQQKDVLIQINNLKQSKIKTEQELELQVDEQIDLNEIIKQLKDFNEKIEFAPTHLQKQLLENLFSKIEIDKDGKVSFYQLFTVEENKTTVGFATSEPMEEDKYKSVIGLGGVGEPTPSKSITFKSNELYFTTGFFEWLEKLLDCISEEFYSFYTSKNPKLKSPKYFSKKTGLSIFAHKEYRIYNRLPSYENFIKILKACDSTPQDFLQVIKDKSLTCNLEILKLILNENNIIRRSARRLNQAY